MPINHGIGGLAETPAIVMKHIAAGDQRAAHIAEYLVFKGRLEVVAVAHHTFTFAKQQAIHRGLGELDGKKLDVIILDAALELKGSEKNTLRFGRSHEAHAVTAKWRHHFRGIQRNRLSGALRPSKYLRGGEEHLRPVTAAETQFIGSPRNQGHRLAAPPGFASVRCPIHLPLFRAQGHKSRTRSPLAFSPYDIASARPADRFTISALLER